MRMTISGMLAAAGLLMAGLSVEAAEPTYQGQFVQGGIVFGQTDAGSKVLLDDVAIDTIASDGRFVLGFPRDYEGPARVSIRHADGSVESFSYDIADREFNIQRIDGLAPKMVNPDPEVISRIQDDSRQAREARTERFAEDFLQSGFVWPAIGPISGVYGSQRILNGEPRAPHWGIDIAVPAGTPVIAPAVPTGALRNRVTMPNG